MSYTHFTSDGSDGATAKHSHSALIVARLLEFFDHRAAWTRALWQVGTVLGLEEVVEYGEAVETGRHSTPEGMKYVCESMRARCAIDPGLGSQAIVDELRSRLDGKQPAAPHSRAALEHIADRSRDGYLLRWARALEADERERPGVEFTARSIAAHMLDEGFSGDHLHGWLLSEAVDADPQPSLPDLLDDAHAMLKRGESVYEVLVPLADNPRGAPTSDRIQGPTKLGSFIYLDQQQTLTWLGDRAGRLSRRPAGALLMHVDALDPWAAVERASEIVARVAARLAVSSARTSALHTTGGAWVAGKADRLLLVETRRQVRIPSLENHDLVYDVTSYEESGLLDDALELLASLEHGATGAAITGGWAAIEGLLVRPREKAVTAADRLADIVACAVPVVELRHLARMHQVNGSDQMATHIADAESGSTRAAIAGRAIATGGSLAVRRASDVAAHDRLQAMFADPSGALERVRRYIAETFRRLYNQRNLLMHAGSFRSVALRATLRTAPALAGAGIDRVVNEQALGRSRATHEGAALALHARAATELKLLGSRDARGLWELLD